MVSGKEPEQYLWLEKALGTSRATWKIAFFHHPPFSPAKTHGDDKTLISLLVPLLERYRVRVVLSDVDAGDDGGTAGQIVARSGAVALAGGELALRGSFEQRSDTFAPFTRARISG